MELDSDISFIEFYKRKKSGIQICIKINEVKYFVESDYMWRQDEKKMSDKELLGIYTIIIAEAGKDKYQNHYFYTGYDLIPV